MLPRLSIRSKLVIAFVGLSTLPIIFVSIYGLYSNVRTMERFALESLTHDVENIRERTGHFMSGVESDLRVLSGSFLFKRYTAGAESASPVIPEGLLRQMEKEFVAFAQTKQIYYQIRLVNEDRDEVLHVSCAGIPDSVLTWMARPSEALHSGGESYYFALTENLPLGQIAFSPAELVYQGETRIPIITFAMPLYRSGKRIGILVADVFARALFREMRSKRTLGIDEKVVLVAGDGHYLYNSEERDQWNKLIATREEDNLQRDYPATIAQMITAGDGGTVTEGSDDIIAHTPLFPRKVDAMAAQPAVGFTESLFVFESVPRTTISRDARSFALTFLGFFVLFLGGAIVLGLLATRQFTKPISALNHGAAILASGNYRERLHVQTGDEIEELAKQFNVMAASLEAHEQEIQQHRSHLQQMVEHRTRELVDEKEKLQAILDNVASAFVLLDKDFRIQTASAAFASITGLHRETVLGQDSRVVLWNNKICAVSPHPDHGTPESVDSHIDHVSDSSGAERHIEHITVPIRKNGKVASLLQVITDITKRTQLEQNLIQSEKLMATGEMSAIIAHGFRNSLTSIKMILQLQSESKQIGRTNRKALGVALDSISGMERMVHELLSFARPAPMVFRVESLNDLVNESLQLLQPVISKHHIDLTKTLDPSLPAMVLDTAHVKEAIVNILLNAVQAIEGCDSHGGNGSLSISTQRIALSRTLHDFHHRQVRAHYGMHRPVPETEITLRKGTTCAVITISDTGPGIDRTVMTRMFDPFFTTKTNGTGLGLPMVKRTVNAHGGIIVVKSTRAKGATVEVFLPLDHTETQRGVDVTRTHVKTV